MSEEHGDIQALGMHLLELAFTDPEEFHSELGRVVDGMMSAVMVTWMLKMVVEVWGEGKRVQEDI